MDILVDNKKTNTIQTGANVTFRTSLAKQDLDANLIIIFKFKTIEENILFHCLSSNSHDSVFNVNSDSYIDLIIPQIPLPPGRYIIELTIKDGGKTLYKNFLKKINVVKGDFLIQESLMMVLKMLFMEFWFLINGFKKLNEDIYK